MVATWPDREGVEWSAEFTTERDAVACVTQKAAGGLRFHDYADIRVMPMSSLELLRCKAISSVRSA